MKVIWKIIHNIYNKKMINFIKFKTHRIDRFLNSWISKKLSVFAISCCFLYYGKLLEDNWTLIAVIYLAAQGTKDIIEIVKAVKK